APVILAEALVHNLAVYQGEEAVVATLADSWTGLEVGASLANDDGPRPDGRAAEDLDPQALRVGVAPVAGGAPALFVCHYSDSSAAAGSAGLAVERVRPSRFFPPPPPPLFTIPTARPSPPPPPPPPPP